MDLFSESEGSSSRSASPDVKEADSNGNRNGADFNINKEYAARFEHNKQRTELHQLEEKLGKSNANGDISDDESSSDDETEDEEGEQITADVDAAILTTLAKIRRKDESIYEAGKRVFDEERALTSQLRVLPKSMKKGDSREKVTLADYQRSRIQELIKTSDDPARALADATMIQRRQDDIIVGDVDASGPLSHTKEQEQLRKEVTSAFHSMGEDGADDFFIKKDGAGEDEVEDDPESYRKFLLGVLGGKDKEEAVREILRTQTAEASAGDAPDPARGKAPKVRVDDNTEQENEEFLMNYVLNRGWVENPNAAPKAKKSVKVKVEGETEMEDADGFSEVSSEDSFDSRAEAFENAYNFRFEELEGGEVEAQIQSYARNPIGSVRRKEDKRKKEREERAKRKELEKEAKKKQIDRMKDLKRKSIVERLKVLKEATGSSNVDFERFQLDDDFDPEEHDRLMQKAFNDEYYGEQDDSKKPTWNEDLTLEDTEQGRKKKVKKLKSKGEEGEDDIEMDADFTDEDGPVQEKKLSKAEKKKLKKREKAKARKQGEGDEETNEVDDDEMNAEINTITSKEIDALNPLQKREKMQEAMNEYYGLEYEDMIGDQPTRFKYTQVSSSNYGLTPEEILLADDEDLQGIVSLKRLQPYREGKSRPSDLNARIKEFRRKYSQRLEKDNDEEEKEEKSKTKRMGKKERQRRKEAAERKAQEEGEVNDEEQPRNKAKKA